WLCRLPDLVFLVFAELECFLADFWVLEAAAGDTAIAVAKIRTKIRTKMPRASCRTTYFKPKHSPQIVKIAPLYSAAGGNRFQLPYRNRKQPASSPISMQVFHIKDSRRP